MRVSAREFKMLKPLLKESFAPRLAALRRKAKLDQSAVGASVGVHQATVSAWEKGRALPSQDHVEALCRLFNVSESELTGDTAPVVAEPGSLRELLLALAALDDDQVPDALAAMLCPKGYDTQSEFSQGVNDYVLIVKCK